MSSLQVCVVGAGYVGLVTGAGLASVGHRVRISEVNPDRLATLMDGKSPIYEPGLEETIVAEVAQGRLSFHASNPEAATDSDIVILAVPTPAAADGSVDLDAVHAVITEIVPGLAPGTILVLKSTVPPGTARRVAEYAGRIRDDIVVANNPEFLSQGRALTDFLEPHRIVIGVDDQPAEAKLRELYEAFDRPVVVTDPTSAEMIKYGSNTWLATRLSFINSMSRLADAVGADIDDVIDGLGRDPRVGPAFLRPGPGFGGSCLPKDTSALIATAAEAGVELELLSAVLDANAAQLDFVVAKTATACGGLESKTIGLWGVAFKAGTDDTRDSPAVALGIRFVAAGATVRAYDPMAPVPDEFDAVSSAFDAADGADVVVIATEWPEFVDADYRKVAEAMRGDAIVDSRNVLDRDRVESAGLRYLGIGR